MFFPGVATIALAAFIVAALNNRLAVGQNGLTVAFVVAVPVIEVVLTGVIVLTLWRLRRYAMTTSG